MTGLPRWTALSVFASVALLGGCPDRGGGSSAGHDTAGDEDIMFPDEADAQRQADAAPPATPTVSRGEGLLEQGEAEEAQQLFQQALEENPRDLRAHLDLGLAREMLGDVQGAERAYRDALSVDPDFTEALNNLGLLLRQLSRPDEAAEMLRHAVEVKPDFGDAWINLALALEESDDLRGAVEAYRRAARWAPRDPAVRANLGLALLELGDTDQAAIELRRAMPLARGDAAALQAIGNGLRRAGQPDAAARAMQMAIEAREGGATPALLAEQALAQRAAGDREGAEASLRRALELDERYATAHYLLGSMLAGDGEYDEAAQHLRRYLALSPHGDQADRAREHLRHIGRH